MILGKATLIEAYRYDRQRVYVLGIIILSVVLNIATIPALYRSIIERKENNDYYNSPPTTNQIDRSNRDNGVKQSEDSLSPFKPYPQPNYPPTDQKIWVTSPRELEIKETG